MAADLSLGETSLHGDSSSLLNDEEYLQDLRLQMLNFARQHMSDRHLAEDTVQEALIGALKNANSFTGKAALKTWVFAILKNKIADSLRKEKRQPQDKSISDNDKAAIEPANLFDAQGAWQLEHRPVYWHDPETSFKQDEFWVVLDTCLNALPANHAKIFMLREFVGSTTTDICASEAVSISNLHVILHRVRLRLRSCLETHWFQKENHHAEL